MRQTIVFLLAGGEGKRLRPLTEDRSKPAVPFGGVWRLVDFTLSNCLHSGMSRIFLLTQYKSESLTRHVYNCWNFLRPQMGESINILPPQIRQTREFYRGTADAVYQNIYTLMREAPRDVLIVSGDHIYSMDYRPLMDFHHKRDADLTIATFPVSASNASRFGILRGEPDGRITSFKEKPSEISRVFAGHDGKFNASMGVYIFKTSVLTRELEEGPGVGRAFDFGKDIIPKMINRDRVFLFPFRKDASGSRAYWRDVGTLDAYYEATMELLGPIPSFKLYEPGWPIFHEVVQNGPATIGTCGAGTVRNSIITSGCKVDGEVTNSIFFSNVTVEAGARVSHAILMPGVHVEANAVVRGAILDKNVWIRRGCMIGMGLKFQHNKSSQNVEYTPSGIAVVPKNEVVGFEKKVLNKQKDKVLIDHEVAEQWPDKRLFQKVLDHKSIDEEVAQRF